MRIATKLNIGILIAFAATVLANYFVLQVTIKPKFDEIEIATSKLNHKRVVDAIETVQAKIRSSTQDWSFWDDTFDFARGENVERYTAANLGSPIEALDGLGIETLIFLNSEGRVLWSVAIDISTKDRIPGLIEEILALNYKHPHVSGAGEAKALSGLIKTSRGLMILASAPIKKSDHTGEPAGMLLMGRNLDEASIKELTGVEFSLDESLAASAFASERLKSQTLDNTILTSSLITDIAGQPLVVLRAETPRDVSAAGTAAILSAILLSVVAAAFVTLALWILVNRQIVTRLVSLKDHIAATGESGQLRRTSQHNSNDELGELARAFNQMTDQVNQLRDALADNAYLCGMSEWAAGTLHNVRNGLSPINAAAWSSKALFDTPWITNVKTALEQLKDPKTPIERREKLNAYVLEKTPQLFENAEKVMQASDEIMTASKSIQDMVSGYEKFSRHEVDVQEIDLRSFLEDIEKSTVAALMSDTRIVMPSGSTMISSNRTLLRQIISNIFTNSIDAMDGQLHEKLIQVEWQDVEGVSGQLRLSISDNGEGIPAEHLKSIFGRGFSTRKNKSGGLGLHWCANAAKALGGTLIAQRGVSGTGATLSLYLPRSTSSLMSPKEAA